MWRPGRGLALPEQVVLADGETEVRVRTNARARRLTLRLARDGVATVTVPPGLSEPDLRAFLTRQSAWLREARERLPGPVPVIEGTCLPVDGVMRRVVRGRPTGLRDGQLVVGPTARTGPAVERFLKAHVRTGLLPEAERVAASMGTPIAAITLRDTRSRWGSCSSAGRLSFSWRIAMAPPDVQRYLAVHEAAHLAEMNHSPRFWALVARHMPDYQTPRRWLKRDGAELHRYRFDTA